MSSTTVRMLREREPDTGRSTLDVRDFSVHGLGIAVVTGVVGGGGRENIVLFPPVRTAEMKGAVHSQHPVDKDKEVGRADCRSYAGPPSRASATRECRVLCLLRAAVPSGSFVPVHRFPRRTPLGRAVARFMTRTAFPCLISNRPNPARHRPAKPVKFRVSGRDGKRVVSK